MKKVKIDIPLSRFEIIIQVLAMMGILYVTFLMVFKYGDLPDNVPTQYNALGETVGWGKKSSLLILYVVAICIYAGLTVLERLPHLYNFPVSITEENIRKQYFLARSLITVLKLAVVAIFLVIMASAFHINTNDPKLLMGNIFMAFVVGTTFLPIIIYFILSIRNK
jgi:hypothetical protein